MSLPSQQQRALINTSEFLYKLLDPKKSPRVPKAVRDEARRLLKHYPFPTTIEMTWPDDMPIGKHHSASSE